MTPIAIGKVSAQQNPYINYTTHNGLPQIQVQFLHQDQKGYIWVGTKGGLARFNGEKFENYLKNQYIFSINETKTGTILIGTRKGIYQFIRGKMELIETFENAGTVVAGKDSYWICNETNIREFKANELVKTYNIQANYSHFSYANFYDATIDAAFFIIKSNPNTFIIIQNQKATPHTVENFLGLRKFENGKVYILKKVNNTFQAIDPFTLEVYFQYEMDNLKFKNFEVFSIPVKYHVFNLQSDYLLIDGNQKKYTKILFPTEKLAFSIILDKDQNFWAGTDNGLYQIGNGALQMFPAAYMSDVWTLIKGDDGFFYGGEYKNGLFKMDFSKSSKTNIPIKGKNGVIEKDYYYGASKDKNGNLYFPSQNGLVKYNYQKGKKLDTDICIFSKYDPYSNQIIYGQENGFALIDANEKKTSFKDDSKKLISSRPTSFEYIDADRIWIGSWENFTLFSRI